jgi:hypothetical protein
MPPRRGAVDSGRRWGVGNDNVGQNKTPRTSDSGFLKCPQYNPIFVFDSQLGFGKRRLVPVNSVDVRN